MAQQDIDITAVGDTLPAGGAKINANFAEVRAELLIAEAAATTAANVAAQASADAAAATSAVATATSDAAAAVAAVAAATAASDAAVAAVTAATANNAVTDAKLRDSAAVSVIGRSANSSGDPADIAAGSNDQVLARVSNALAFQQLTVGMVPNDLITYAKLQNVANTSRLLGRITSGAGDAEELTGTQATTLLDAFTSTLKGLAPASGGGTSTYLRADGIWSAPPSPVSDILRTGWKNVLDYGALCDTTAAGVGTDDTAAIQAAVDAIASGTSGIIFIPRLAKISSTITAANKQSIAFVGPPNSSMMRGATFLGPTAGLVAATGWGATTPLIKVTSTFATSDSGGAFTMMNLALIPCNTSGTGYGVLFEKDTGTGKDSFIGNIFFSNCNMSYFAKAIAIDDSANHSWSAPTVNGTGFGWFTVQNCRMPSNVYAIHANCDINVGNFHNNNFAHSHGTASGNYLTRTGGAIVLKTGASINITGNDFEDSQVGVHLSSASAINIKGNYFEVMWDAAIVLSGTKDVLIEGNYVLTNASYNTDHVFIQSTRNITLRNNTKDLSTGMFLVMGYQNRDSVTDCPLRTQFSSASDGSQTLDGKGVVISSLDVLLNQPTVSTNVLMTSCGLSLATQAEITGISPLGFNNKAAAITATSANGKAQPAWNSYAVVAGNWLVTTIVMRMDTTVSADSCLLIVNENKGLGAGLETVYSGTLNSGIIRKGEVVAIQWHHKVATGEAATFSTRLEARIPGSGDVQKLYGMGHVISNQPFVRPQSWEMVSSGGTERYLTSDGRVFYGANVAASPPAATTLTWSVGDQVWRTGAAATEIPGWLCTTAGAGGTAVFKALPTMGTMAETSGGTGQSTITQGDILYGSAADTIAKLAKSATATHALLNTGTSNNPAWGQVPLATGVSGTLAAANLPTLTGAQAATMGVSAAVDIQLFTSSGTWTKPAGTPKATRVIAIGNGGGGGGGSRVASGSVSSGGGGGGAGGYADVTYLSSGLAGTYTVTIGTAGTGGNGGASTPSVGSDGTAGTSNTFGTLLTVYAGGLGAGGQLAGVSGGGAAAGKISVGGNATGGTGGTAGTVAGANGGAGLAGATNSAEGGSGGAGGANGAAGATSGAAGIGATGGGGGGGINTGPAHFAGGIANANMSTAALTGGTAGGGAGNPGPTPLAYAGGGGGSGGGGNTGGVGGAGGAGAKGGGGGGGGAAVAANGGAGGAGGLGYIVVLTYF